MKRINRFRGISVCGRRIAGGAVLSAVLAALVLGYAWSSSNPSTPEAAMNKEPRYVNSRFLNAEPTTVMKPGTLWDTSFTFLFGGSSARTPAVPLPVVPVTFPASDQASPDLEFVWLGHAGVLLEMGGKRVLIDPVFSERASLFQWVGPKRFQPSPLQAEAVPSLDAVLISHDHYDHLDRATIIALAAKTASFHCPLGVGAHLQDWGVPPAKIHEYAWWDGHDIDGIRIVATPARHFSGRGPFDRFKTLWCSWVLLYRGQKVFHSGDTGATAQFRRIGAKYGPFDLAFVKMAAYNENWPDIHLNPEQAVLSCRDLGVRTLVPIHWGVFDLSLHSWYEPIERLVKEAERQQVHVLTPKMGERVDPDRYENGYWWRKYIPGNDTGKKAHAS